MTSNPPSPFPSCQGSGYSWVVKCETSCGFQGLPERNPHLSGEPSSASYSLCGALRAWGCVGGGASLAPSKPPACHLLRSPLWERREPPVNLWGRRACGAPEGHTRTCVCPSAGSRDTAPAPPAPASHPGPGRCAPSALCRRPDELGARSARALSNQRGNRCERVGRCLGLLARRLSPGFGLCGWPPGSPGLSLPSGKTLAGPSPLPVWTKSVLCPASWMRACVGFSPSKEQGHGG